MNQPQNKSKFVQEYYESNASSKALSNQNEETLKADVPFYLGERVEDNFSIKSAIEGVIWAEILGPPRALKSHSIRRVTSKR